ncbi:hypothetical protein N9C70_05390 [Flavobacteriales bacterium]|nr:hypothetical protein [Flavobacteriales bacterium]
MNEKSILRLFILIFWTFFWGLSVTDKIIPDVQFLWVGKDFFALFVKFFGSLGLKNPLFATTALAGVSALEALNFALYLTATLSFFKGNETVTEKWFFRAILSSMVLFSLFSIADQVFGDRFQLLEHGLFWLILLASWIAFKHIPISDGSSYSWKPSSASKRAILAGSALTLITAWSVWDFAGDTFANVDRPVTGEEVVEGIYKFDFPFLADKLVWEQTVNAFKSAHPGLAIDYIYTGPSELNSKKKTHLLLYIFTHPLALPDQP